ncbi:uncharacterized protein A4U43_C07F39240 [Asparagus officinalis]|uniref:Uncharacterized protein n=1 Tax=Asparagus officinalis TaxID=4686 RepID=A0A5P1EI74_ASPOF|nr:uncharacterized protein A4U43_C07F39240 [Asparagus officinalis]
MAASHLSVWFSTRNPKVLTTIKLKIKTITRRREGEGEKKEEEGGETERKKKILGEEKEEEDEGLRALPGHSPYVLRVRSSGKPLLRFAIKVRPRFPAWPGTPGFILCLDCQVSHSLKASGSSMGTHRLRSCDAAPGRSAIKKRQAGEKTQGREP